MTGEEILAYGEELIDDTFGSTDYIMMNIAYREVLAERPWRFLVKWYESQDFSSQVTLPADFNSTLPDEEGHGHLFVGTPNNKYLEIDIKKKIDYENTTGFFYIDRANNKIVFTGNAVDSGKVKLPYIFDPDDITETTSPTFGFKKGFQPFQNIGVRSPESSLYFANFPSRDPLFEPEPQSRRRDPLGLLLRTLASFRTHLFYI